MTHALEGIPRVFTVASLQRLKMEALIPAPADSEVLPVRMAHGLDPTRLIQRVAGSNRTSGMDVRVRLCVCKMKPKTTRKEKITNKGT